MDFVDEFVFCDNDEENEAVVYCVDCDQNLCRECDDVFHRSKARQSHRRRVVNQPTVSDDDSDSCSTNTASSCSHSCSHDHDHDHNHDEEVPEAKEAPPKVESLFGGSLESCMESQKSTHPNLKVPMILHCMIRAIIQKGGLKEEGIFRISVDRNELLKTKSELSQGQYNLPYDSSAHVAACLLKMWLRELKEPVIPAKMYNKAIACIQPPVRKGNVLGVWAEMDALRQRVLNQIAGLVQKLVKADNSASNKMSFKSLAIVFAPSLLRYMGTDGTEAMKNARAEIDFVKALFEVLPTQHLGYLYQPSGHVADRLLTKTTVITKQTIQTTTMTSETVTTTTTEAVSPAKPSVSMPVLRPRSPNVPTNKRRSKKTSPSFKISQNPQARPTNTAGRHIVKILVVGNSSCGKTSLIRRYVNDCFDEQYITTVGADYKSKHVSWQDGTEVQLQLWDIAGQDRYARMTRPYYQGAEGAVVVCDVTRDVSIEAVKAWKADIDFNLPDIPVILVANKCDLLKDGTAGMVIGGRLQGLSSKLDFKNWQIISAKKDMNVNEAMNSLIKAVLEKKSKDKHKTQMKRQMMAQKSKGGLRVEGGKKDKRRMKRKSGSSGSKKQDSGCVVC